MVFFYCAHVCKCTSPHKRWHCTAGVIVWIAVAPLAIHNITQTAQGKFLCLDVYRCIRMQRSSPQRLRPCIQTKRNQSKTHAQGCCMFFEPSDVLSLVRTLWHHADCLGPSTHKGYQLGKWHTIYHIGIYQPDKWSTILTLRFWAARNYNQGFVWLRSCERSFLILLRFDVVLPSCKRSSFFLRVDRVLPVLLRFDRVLPSCERSPFLLRFDVGATFEKWKRLHRRR